MRQWVGKVGSAEHVSVQQCAVPYMQWCGAGSGGCVHDEDTSCTSQLMLAPKQVLTTHGTRSSSAGENALRSTSTRKLAACGSSSPASKRESCVGSGSVRRNNGANFIAPVQVGRPT